MPTPNIDQTVDFWKKLYLQAFQHAVSELKWTHDRTAWIPTLESVDIYASQAAESAVASLNKSIQSGELKA